MAYMLRFRLWGPQESGRIAEQHGEVPTRSCISRGLRNPKPEAMASY